MSRLLLAALASALAAPLLIAQSPSLALLPGERWWGGHSARAHEMPFPPGYAADLADNAGNQVQPLLLSNRGRYVWSEGTFRFRVTADSLLVAGAEAPVVSDRAGETLRSAYAAAAERFFGFAGELPDERLFATPQYNTWIELIYDQNQADVLRYARGVIDNGMAPGVLMIDDNWQRDYGDWRFRPDRFPDPRAMIDSLHGMGFAVMLWVCPFVSPDHENFRFLAEERDALLRDPVDTAAAKVVRWWNGYSAVLDLTRPDAEAWLAEQLAFLRDEYGVDGFKLDAGDFGYYEDALAGEPGTTPAEQSELFARFGLRYPLNEYRAAFKVGGLPLAQRLRDKAFAWGDLRELIPGMTTMGLLGYPFACPDMIGGGEYRSFLSLDSIDQELVVRSAQVHALMPMMQFSVAPWRVLDATHLAAVREAAALHTRFGEEIVELARESARTGEPIVRPLAYAYPEGDYAEVRDQFLLGDRYLVAPVVERGARRRRVEVPPGRWRKWGEGEAVAGPTAIEVDVALSELAWWERISEK